MSFGSLAAGLGVGTMAEVVRRTFDSGNDKGGIMSSYLYIQCTQIFCDVLQVLDKDMT